jgi:glutaredoxin
VQQVLQLAELQYVIYKLNTDFTREEFYAEFGEGSTFPQVVVGDQHIGGCTDTVQYLKEQNLV